MEYKTINLKNGWVAKNLLDYDVREIMPVESDETELGKGYNFQIAVYDSFFSEIGLFPSKKAFLDDLEENAGDGSWEVELYVLDDGRYIFWIGEPYDYDGKVSGGYFLAEGDTAELADWVKDGLDYIKNT